MKAFRFTLLAFATLVLTACSGGGGSEGGGGSNPAPLVASQSTIYTTLTAGLGAQTFTEKIIKYFTNGSQSLASHKATPSGQFTVATDHVTLTGAVNFSDGTQAGPTTYIVEPLLSTNPVLTGANYPSNWTSGGTVTPPHVSTAAGIYIDGASYSANGTVTAPFRQASLTPNGPTGDSAINDPNAYVTAPTKGVYDLHWGTPDPAGPGYAASYANGNYSFLQNYNWFGHKLNAYCSGSTCTSPLLIGKPSQDVLDALNKGWSGKGSNVLIVDSFIASQSVHPSNEDYHGAITSLLAWRYAPGANFFALDAFYGAPAIIFPDASVIDTSGLKLTNYIANSNSSNPNRLTNAFYVDVVNMSFGWGYQDFHRSLPQQQSDATSFISYASVTTNKIASLLNGTTSTSVLGNVLASGSAVPSLTDSVITVAAGNEAIRSDWSPLPHALAYDANLGPRTLIVGALDKSGAVGTNGGPGTASIYAQYTATNGFIQGSNTAGYDLTIQNRFLVASGINPFPSTTVNGKATYGISIDGTPTPVYWGTSFAAPRVAGYAAIIHQKFPNLTAPNTADILLATARYDTLTCYPNCDKSIYGQGEASLSRALAPVGYLR